MKKRYSKNIVKGVISFLLLHLKTKWNKKRFSFLSYLITLFLPIISSPMHIFFAIAFFSFFLHFIFLILLYNIQPKNKKMYSFKLYLICIFMFIRAKKHLDSFIPFLVLESLSIHNLKT